MALLPLVLLVHGFHPFAEDGGLYVAGVEYTLHPALFPHETAFVTEHLRFSCFAPAVASLVRLTHLSLAWVLLCLYVASAALMLFAAARIVAHCFPPSAARWPGVALLAAWWTLPVAGTSLLLMDPYVTARSFSTPLCLMAVAASLKPRGRSGYDAQPLALLRLGHRPAIEMGLWLTAAVMFHPLMAGYALGLVLAVRLSLRHSRAWVWCAFAGAALLLPGLLQISGRPDAVAVLAAVHSRYYWFLAQWHWFEIAGLLGPVLIFAALLWSRRYVTLTASGLALCRAAIFLAVLAATVALLFAQEHFPAHPVARLQPLRAFLLLYAILPLVLGPALAQTAHILAQRASSQTPRLLLRALPGGLIAGSMLAMFLVARAGFPASPQLELPWRTNANPWVQAFLWSRDHTPSNALFALDARYVNTDGEDAQTFRALAQRSAIPDFSKDGGEAAITPALAPEWFRAAAATADLSALPDLQRDARLQPFAVDWIVLHAGAPTTHPCPYRNAVVKVCQLR